MIIRFSFAKWLVPAAMLLVAVVLPANATAAFPGANGKIAFGCGAICVTDPRGQVVTRVAQRGFNYAPVFSADGKWIAFSSYVRANGN